MLKIKKISKEDMKKMKSQNTNKQDRKVLFGCSCC